MSWQIYIAIYIGQVKFASGQVKFCKALVQGQVIYWRISLRPEAPWNLLTQKSGFELTPSPSPKYTLFAKKDAHWPYEFLLIMFPVQTCQPLRILRNHYAFRVSNTPLRKPVQNAGKLCILRNFGAIRPIPRNQQQLCRLAVSRKSPEGQNIDKDLFILRLPSASASDFAIRPTKEAAERLLSDDFAFNVRCNFGSTFCIVRHRSA